MVKQRSFAEASTFFRLCFRELLSTGNSRHEVYRGKCQSLPLLKGWISPFFPSSPTSQYSLVKKMKHTDSPKGYRIAFQGLFSNHIPEISVKSQEIKEIREIPKKLVWAWSAKRASFKIIGRKVNLDIKWLPSLNHPALAPQI